jgi:geranylgeranyl pyrophosphate synthase
MQDFVSLVRKGIQSATTPERANPILAEIGRYAAVDSAGKLARPRLVNAFGRAVGLSESALEPIAIATELVHVASLLHDDIVDEAYLRRGKTAANRIWGNGATVLGGDFLLCRALITLECEPELARRCIHVIEEMTSAAVLEVTARADARLGNLFDSQTSRDVSSGKTAALFAWCGWAPATRAGQPDDAEAFALIGRHLGRAFQYADDIHDFVIAAKGDRPLSDLRTRNPNLVIALAAEFDESAAERLNWLWVQDELPEASVTRVAQTICSTDAIELASGEVDAALDAALEAAAPFMDRPGFDDIVGWIAWARAWKDEARQPFEGAHASA